MSAEQWKGVRTHCESEWDNTIVKTLSDYIEVPNQSPHYDAEWATNGLMMKAFNILTDWMKTQKIAGITHEMIEEPGRTPFLIIEVPATGPDASGKTCMMYGHMDKQPPLLPWDEGLHPYKPVYKDGKLYGRAGADDGYAICAALTSIAALQEQKIPHGRIVVLVEACEESGSFDLPHYINLCKSRIGNVDLVVCLDSGAMNYEQLWLTTSLRGVTGGYLTIDTLREGMHSGVAGGVVPDTFQVLRIILDRIQDPVTGNVKIKELYCPIPDQVKKDYEPLRDIDFPGTFLTLPGVQLEGKDNVELGLRNFWGPSLTVIGADLPATAKAGNVIRTQTKIKISCRLPPLVKPSDASAALKREIERDPPAGAKVHYDGDFAAAGWAPPLLKPWLEKALNVGSTEYWGKGLGCVGQGGSIPFMGMLGEMFPEAQFVVTGVLGPMSNAHGPNEFLHVPFGKGVTYCVARIAAAHYDSHQQ